MRGWRDSAPLCRLRRHLPHKGADRRRRNAEFAGNAADVARQDGREVGVDDGGVAAADQLDQRRDLVADRQLAEADAGPSDSNALRRQ